MDLELLEPELDLIPPKLLEVIPGLQKLLGGTGASPEVEQELREAHAHWKACRGAWLRWECLWRALRELSLRQRPLEAAKLQLCLETPKDLPQLGPPQAPPPACLLLPPLEELLREKLKALELYQWGETCPGSGDQWESSKEPPGGVASSLDADLLRLRHARRRGAELRKELERHRERCLEVLSHSRSLLAALQGVVEEKAELDRDHAQYLENKAEALLRKISLEETELLLATYPPPTVEAHQRIRSALEEGRGQVRREAELVQESLSAYQLLGSAFCSLADQYQSLRQKLQRGHWTLSQLGHAHP